MSLLLPVPSFEASYRDDFLSADNPATIAIRQ